MTIMAYFSTADRVELPMSGFVWAWSGAFAPGRTDARTQMIVVRGKTRYMITADTFGGQSVRVKIWAKGGSDYWWLVPGPVDPIMAQGTLPVTWVTDLVMAQAIDPKSRKELSA